MNVQDYIESGSIESCILQLASEREQRELDRLCVEYPEIQAARTAFELCLEKAAMEGAVQPAPFIRDSVLSVIHDSAGAANKTSKPELNTSTSTINWRKLSLAAALILLAGSAALNIYLYNQYTSSRNRYTTLLAEQQQMAAANKAIQAKLSVSEKDLAMMKDPRMQMVKLDDMNKTNSMGTVYWDSLSKNVYLLVNHLPKPEAGQQYQLWAIVDGQPVDAGMIQMDSETALLAMKKIMRAEAFAITLEKEGGSPSPTLTALYVMGKV